MELIGTVMGRNSDGFGHGFGTPIHAALNVVNIPTSHHTFSSPV